MDGLWDPPNYQETEDPNSFCLAYDVLEETTLNEKSCIQVLSILIGKADNDIIELEEELMDLVTQLACTDEEFSDMFCTSLRVKSDFLDLSIRKLKDDARDFSLSSGEPAESINDMLKSLFCCYLRKKDQQKFADNTTVASSSYHQVHSDKLSGKKKQKGGSSNANHMGKSTSVIVTPLEKHTISQAKVKVEEENADPCMTPVSEYTSECRFRGSIQNMNIEGNKFQIKSPIITNDVPKNKISRCKSICQKSKTKGKWNYQLKMVKSQPDDQSIGYTSICLVESSQETNAKQKISKELGFFLGNSNPEDNQEPKASFSQSLCLVDPSMKPKAKQTITKELGFSHGNSNPEDHQELKASLSQSLSLVESSQKPKAKDNITKELGFCRGNSNPEDHQEPKSSLSQSLCLVDSSRRPKVKQNITKGQGFFHGNSNPENHQEPKASLSESLYSTKTYKRRERLSSPWQSSSSSLLLLEEPKPLPILDVDVSNLHDMDYYTVDDLKGIARQRNMKGYYKLRKAELAQLLGIKVTEGKRKQKRKETLSSSKDKGCAVDIAA